MRATRRSPSAVSFGTPIFISGAEGYAIGPGVRPDPRPLRRDPRQRRQSLQGVQLLVALDVDRRADQAVDAGAAEALDPLGDFGLGPDQRGRLDDLVRHRLEGAAAVPVLEALLHLV